MFFQSVTLSLFALVLGLILCFAGFRFFVLLLPLLAFLASFLVTAQTIQELFSGGFLATMGSWVFGFVVGIAFALVASVGYELGVGIMSGVGVSSGWLLFGGGVVLAAAEVAAVIFLN